VLLFARACFRSALRWALVADATGTGLLPLDGADGVFCAIAGSAKPALTAVTTIAIRKRMLLANMVTLQMFRKNAVRSFLGHPIPHIQRCKIERFAQHLSSEPL
jgi:hypothetical protein